MHGELEGELKKMLENVGLVGSKNIGKAMIGFKQKNDVNRSSYLKDGSTLWRMDCRRGRMETRSAV